MQQQVTWASALQKAIQGNRQLEFTSNYFVSFVGENAVPKIDQLRYRTFPGAELNESLISFFDKRSTLYQHLVKNSVVSVCWTFPLSKEKFILECTVKEEIAHPALNSYWTKCLVKEERSSFQAVQPDQPTVEKQELTDLDKFNAQEKTDLSENFGVLLLIPYSIEHTIHAMPQVVADSRTQFESIMRPYKTNKKYLYSKKPDGTWKLQALTIA